MSDDPTFPRNEPDATTGDHTGAVADDSRYGTPVSSEAEGPFSFDSSTQNDDVQYGIGPFSIREIALLGVWLLAFIVSFFSVWVDTRVQSVLLPFGSVWSSGIDWILTIGVPTAAVFLIVLRRFSPDGIRRVGSLAVDQFASVAFSVSALIWLGTLWTNIARGIQTGLWLSSWVVWVEFLLMLAGVFLTVLAPFIPPFDEDFRGRPDVPAHRSARPVRTVVPRPAKPAPTHEEPVAETGQAPAPVATSEPEPVFAPFDDQRDPEPAPAATQAFWALAPVERDVVDENGIPLFTIGPTAWALVIEDRGDTFVVRHEDGRVGYLHDVAGVTRG